jgi:ABC-type transporter MlaC component
MRLVKAIFILLLAHLIIAPTLQYAHAEDESAATSLISLIHEAASARSLTTLRATIDAPEIARNVLGNYWQSVGANERQNFADALVDAIVAALVRRFNGDAETDLTFLGSLKLSNGDILVRTRITRPGSYMRTIDWQTRLCPAGICLADVITDGASVFIQRRNEYAAKLENGESIAELISSLRAEIQPHALQ